MPKKADPIFTTEQLEKVKGGVYSSWNAIAYDMDWTGIRSNQRNAVAVECSLDADRMVMFGGKEGVEAQRVYREALDKHGYQKVFKFLVKNIHLE